MKSRLILCILFCFAIILPLAYTVAAPPIANQDVQEKVTVWEHLALTQDDAGLGGGLSGKIISLGKKGWQLVGVTPIAKEGTTVKTVYYFKRPK